MTTGRPRRIPDSGDVGAGAAAARMGLSLEEFARVREQLEDRGFPSADPTTGLYCIEAIDRWRRLRTPRLFPELTATPIAKHAGTIRDERRQRLFGQH